MKKTFTAVAVLALSASLAFAHEGGEGRGRHGRGGRDAAIAQKLNLTDAQKQQWQQLRESFRTANQPLFDAMRQTMTELKAAKEAGDTARAESLKGTIESQRTQLKAQKQAQRERFAALLTAEQRAKFEALKAERGARGRGKHRR